MPNTYVNKVITGAGSTLIDLSQDTVTSASHIIGGRVGHLADGSSVSGTGSKTVTYSLSNGVSANVSPDSIITGEGLCLRLLAPSGYDLSNISVTMGGVDITNSVFAFDTKEEPTLITKSITSSGTYNASDDSADGYSSVTVNVSGGTPAISVVDTTDSNGGTVRTITALDISDTTAIASDVASGKYFYTAGGVKTAGTANGGAPSTTSHEIHLEFSDGTDTDIEVDYDDTWVGTLITSTKPTIYGVKTIDSAALDNVTWYERLIVPLNTELVDYTTVSSNTAIGSDGEAFTQEWSYTSDYIPIDPSMTFSYTNYYWFYIGVYDSSHNVVRAIYAMTDSTADPNDGNTGHGTLSGNELSGASYIRLCGAGASSSYMSLIRTA